MVKAILRAFGKAQRPVAWSILALTPFVVGGVTLDIFTTGDAKLATILAALILMNDAFAAVMEVENELESEGSAQE